MTARPVVLAAMAEVFADADSMSDVTPLDSLAVVILAFELEDRLGVDIPDDVTAEWRTVGDVIAGVEEMARPC
jgi:acyl carrier protein